MKGARWSYCFVAVMWLAGHGFAALDPPPSPSALALSGFVAKHADEAFLVTDRWTAYDLRYDRGKRGLVGEYVVCEEYLLQSGSALEYVSTVVAVNSFVIELVEYRAEVFSQDGSTRSVRSKELRWTEVPQQRPGVVVLDGSYRVASVPGIRIGDRVRHLTRYRLRGMHGFPAMLLGGGRTPVFQAAAEIRVPRDYRLESELLGVPELVAAARNSDSQTASQRIIDWRLADADLDSTACKVDHGVLRVVSHIRDAGADHGHSMAVGESWSEVGQAYLDRVGKATFEANREMRRQAQELAQGASTPAEVIDRIYRSVQRSCRYLGLYERLGGILPTPAIEVYESGFGDCKGLGTLLISMLRAVGIEAHPVLVATSDSGGFLSAVPNMTQFNHFIVWADDGAGGMWLDATADYTPAGRIHLWAARYPVLLLQPGSIRLAEIPRQAWDAGTEMTTLRGSIDGSGRLTAEIELEVAGVRSSQLRASYAGLTVGELQDRGRARFSNAGLAFDVLAPRIDGIDDWLAPVRIAAQLASTSPLPRAGALLLLPKSLIESPGVIREIPTCSYEFSLRAMPAIEERWQIELPEDLELAGDDAEYCVDGPGLHWCRRVWIEGRVLHLSRSIRPTLDSLDAQALAGFAAATQRASQAESGYFQLRRAE